MKLDKQDKKIMIIAFISGIVFNLLIDKAVDIIIMVVILYFIHKYIKIMDTYEKSGEVVEYIDKEIYFNKLKKSVVVLDIYVIIKSLILLIFKIGAFSGLEIMFISQFIVIYAEYLERQYIKSIDGVDIEKKIKLVNNKLLLSAILVVFIGFTYTYFNNIEKNENYIKSKDYEYKLSENEEGQRVVDLSGNGFYQQAIESKDNFIHFEQYIKNSKTLLNVNIMESYFKVAMIFMFVLAISQIRFKEKNKKASTVALNIFLSCAMLFGSIGFNTYSIDLEYKIVLDLVNYDLY